MNVQNAQAVRVVCQGLLSLLAAGFAKKGITIKQAAMVAEGVLAVQLSDGSHVAVFMRDICDVTQAVLTQHPETTVHPTGEEWQKKKLGYLPSPLVTVEPQFLRFRDEYLMMQLASSAQTTINWCQPWNIPLPVVGSPVSQPPAVTATTAEPSSGLNLSLFAGVAKNRRWYSFLDPIFEIFNSLANRFSRN